MTALSPAALGCSQIENRVEALRPDPLSYLLHRLLQLREDDVFLFGEEAISMSYMEMKNTILFHYHKTIDFWFKLVGEMFEATDGFSNAGSLKRNLCGESCTIIWNSHEWVIDEPNKMHWNGLYWENI